MIEARVLPGDRAVASFERLRAYLSARATLTPGELDLIQAHFAPRRLAKGEVLQQAGEPARHMAFVAKGCLRSYVIDDEGQLHILRFAPEDWWLADSARFFSGEPSSLFIDAIEASDLLLIDTPSHQRILDAVPGYAAAYRVGLERLAAAEGQAHHQLPERVGPPPLPGVRRAVSDPLAARAPAHAGLVPRHVARDAQPDPQEALEPGLRREPLTPRARSQASATSFLTCQGRDPEPHLVG
ncbi:MAG TPA: cyclic nucleotide-binding domain-containing protein [Vicinamibacteria bacterium]|nr:cyclic nucleotide-binding domain-containing protein [Vicinamibacteria bacterium]